jgi:hypothetical protein
MRNAIVAAVALVALAGCSQKAEYSSGEVDSTADSSHTNVDVGSTTDTINVPTLGIEKDTVVVDKPVLGRKPVVVKHPTVDVKKTP